jgi:Family of unknown function (DUF6281)
MRWIPILVAALLLPAGCGGDGETDGADRIGSSQSECWATVRFEDTIYRAWVENLRPTPSETIGTADLADCDDVGVDAQGPYFPSEPRQADVSALLDYPTSEVIGVHEPDGFTVYVAETVPTKKAEAIAAELKRRS